MLALLLAVLTLLPGVAVYGCACAYDHCYCFCFCFCCCSCSRCCCCCSADAGASVGNRGFVAKVADFGLARSLTHKSKIITKTYGTITHMVGFLFANDMEGCTVHAKDLHADHSNMHHVLHHLVCWPQEAAQLYWRNLVCLGACTKYNMCWYHSLLTLCCCCCCRHLKSLSMALSARPLMCTALECCSGRCVPCVIVICYFRVM